MVVHDGRVYFNYRYRLFSVDAKTGKPAPGWGNDSGWVDLREGLGRPVKGLSVSASTPGAVYKDMLIIGTAVPEALPSAPGDIRAYDVKTIPLLLIVDKQGKVVALDGNLELKEQDLAKIIEAELAK